VLKQQAVDSAMVIMKKHYPKYKPSTVTTPTRTWLCLFAKRHSIKRILGQQIEKVRSETATVGNINWCYSNVVDDIDWDEYSDRFIFNADESMVQQKGRRVVMVPKDTKVALVKNDDDTDHITIMCCIAANGDSMTPMIIFPLKNNPIELDDLIQADKLTIAGQTEGWISTKTFSK